MSVRTGALAGSLALIAVCAGRRRPISFAGWGSIGLGLGALWSTTLLSDRTVGSSAFMLALGADLLLLAGLVLNVAAGVKISAPRTEHNLPE